jgi:hypothetical protein
MEAENFNLGEIRESRRSSVAASLREVGVEEIRKLEEEIFPAAGGPWKEIFQEFVNENAGSAFFHGVTGDGFVVLYCRAQEKGFWFKRGTGVGWLQAGALAAMKELVDHRGTRNL